MVAKNEVKKVECRHELVKHPHHGRPAFSPETDIYETEEAIHMAMNMPGVDEKAINLSFDGDMLSVEAPQTEETELKGMREFYSGYKTGVYKRSFTILVDVDRESIKAKATNGVLRLTLPKTKKEEPKRIEIAVE